MYINYVIFQAGIIEEMLDETMSEMDDPEEMEEEAQEEIDKVRNYAVTLIVSMSFQYPHISGIVGDHTRRTWQGTVSFNRHDISFCD